MAFGNPSAIREQTFQVIDHHHDTGNPDKPLFMLVPGGVGAVAALAFICFLGYRTFLDESMTVASFGYSCIGLVPVFVGATFIFSYGYELYDLKKALKLTATIGGIALAAVVIVVVLVVVAQSGWSTSSRSKRSGGSGRKIASGAAAVAVLSSDNPRCPSCGKPPPCSCRAESE
jgi:hypothetical protein